MNTAFEHSIAHIATAARGIGRAAAAAFRWLAAAKEDIRTSRPLPAHAPLMPVDDRAPAAGDSPRSGLCSATRELFGAAPGGFAAASVRIVSQGATASYSGNIDAAGDREMMQRIEIYTKDWCAFSMRAKALLDAKGLDYDEIDVTSDIVREREMIALSGRHTVPQVFIDGEPFGGSDDLARLEATGALDRILGGGLSRRRPVRAA